MRAVGKLVKLVWASCLYTCLKNTTVLALTASCFSDLPRSGGIFQEKFFILYLVIPLVAVLATLFIEVEGYAIFCDFGGDKP